MCRNRISLLGSRLFSQHLLLISRIDRMTIHFAKSTEHVSSSGPERQRPKHLTLRRRHFATLASSDWVVMGVAWNYLTVFQVPAIDLKSALSVAHTPSGSGS